MTKLNGTETKPDEHHAESMERYKEMKEAP